MNEPEVIVAARKFSSQILHQIYVRSTDGFYRHKHNIYQNNSGTFKTKNFRPYRRCWKFEVFQKWNPRKTDIIFYDSWDKFYEKYTFIML